MAEIGASLVGAAATELGKCIAEPIKRQFNYLCCFNSNVQNLRDEAKKLEDAKDGLEMRVTRAKNNAEVIVPVVNSWIEKSNENSQVNMERIESEIAKTKESGCLAVKSRYSLSRKAKKATEAMKLLREECRNFDVISEPAPPPAVISIPSGSTYEFESRKRIEDDIMKTLKDNKVSMVGIYGMGGVGKTTMAERVMERARGENLFDEIVKVVVSQPVNKLEIQKEMAEHLGLELKEEHLSSRANRLRTRLTTGKSCLIVLDDVWEKLKLEELIGIPSQGGSKACTILLTSRDRHVLYEMDVEREEVFEIQTLSKEEAWSLFKEKVGTCVDDHDVHPVAQKVVRECNCLPLALVIVGVALKGEKDTSVWKGVLQKLQKSNPKGLPNVLVEVYNPLKLSYDSLDNEHAKLILLLCCLFPEDYNIPLGQLTMYAMGLRMLEGIESLEQSRNETSLLVKTLMDRSLLLEGRRKHCVRVHDLVRDVAIFIASSKDRQLIRCGDKCKWLSPFVEERIELSNGSTFPSLRLLLIDESAKKEFQINDDSFGGMTNLNVLSMENYSLASLPPTIQLLKSLRTLLLYSCSSLETISIVGELQNLEIFICRFCDELKELPVEIGKLSRLRWLEIFFCNELKKIAPGVISKLDKLEYLRVLWSFDGWEAGDNNNEGKGRENAGLRELESLSNLWWLEIEIEDSALAAESIRLPGKLEKFDIRFGRSKWFEDKLLGFDKKLQLELRGEISLGHWINMHLLTSTEHLRSIGDGSNNLKLAKPQNLRSLCLEDCLTMKKLVNITSTNGTNSGFSLLESLELRNLPKLEKLCEPISNLSSIIICQCHSLHDLFSLAMAKDCLLQLQSLDISECDMMKQVLLWNEDEESQKDTVESGSRRHRIRFPKLKKLRLWALPNLTTFCRGIEGIEFSLPTEMEIGECPKLTSFLSTASSTETGNDENNSASINHDDDSLHWLCEGEKVAFNSLKRFVISDDRILRLWCRQIPMNFFTGLEQLEIKGCANIKSLFSSSLVAVLENLKELEIHDCGEMVEVIENNKEKDTHQITISLFPNLKFLYLKNLPKLKRFCEWKCTLKLPSLEKVKITGCPKMESFSLVSALTTPNLKMFRVYDCPNIDRLLGSLTRPILEEIIVNNVNTNDFIGVKRTRRLKMKSCQMTEQVVLLLLNEEENNQKMDIGHDCWGGGHVSFPELEKLELLDMPNLTTFCKGIFESIEFPMLTKVEIMNCPNLKTLVSNSGGINHGDDGDDDDSLHLFCNPKVSFGSLKELWIYEYRNTLRLWCCHIPIDFFNRIEELWIGYCDNITSLFSSSIARNLDNLNFLRIYGCGEMVQVIKDEEQEKDAACGGQSQTTICLFRRLEELSLASLSKLEIFSEWRSSRALVLPSLKQVEILDCPKMEKFSLGSLTTPSLRIIGTDHGNDYETKDLNGAMQKYFFRVKEEEEKKKREEEKKDKEKEKREEEERQKEEHTEEDQKRRGEIIEEVET